MSRSIRTKLATVVGTVALASAGVVSLAVPASASASDCHSGLVNSNKGWGQCRSSSDGWGGFTLTVNCYLYPQQVSYGQAPQTIWASCPSWSHVTATFAVPAAF